jgi:predicted HicB family RNase H-like nuclease
MFLVERNKNSITSVEWRSMETTKLKRYIQDRRLLTIECRKEKKKTILRTIRIDKDLDDAFDEDAKENDVSENSLISSIPIACFCIISLKIKYVQRNTISISSR